MIDTENYIIVVAAHKRNEDNEFMGFVCLDDKGQIYLSSPYEPAPRSSEMSTNKFANAVKKHASIVYPDYNFIVQELDDDDDDD